jgi:secreted PhoX family phosphatase
MVAGMSVAEVLVFTRLAADKVGATKMDRPEDIEPNPATGKVYLALTNNTNRGRPGFAGVDEANPRTPNREGHVLELTETGNDAAATTFAWNLLLVCGLPESAGTYFGGYDGPVSPISCPDNVAFDQAGDLWISTDGQPGTIGLDDALHRVTLEGTERGRVEQFLAVPRDAETCGPVIDSQDGMVYVAVQHPGEDGSWVAPRSFFPDYLPQGALEDGSWGGPRPSVIQVFRNGS